MSEQDIVQLVDGSASGPVLILDEPLSLWGGLDAKTGLIIDGHHPQHGTCVSGTILVMPFGRGSSSASSVLAEAIRLRTAPAAFLLSHPDEIVALGALVGHELYGIATPIALIRPDIAAQLTSGDIITIAHGRIRF